jgi:hypothetical protein
LHQLQDVIKGQKMVNILADTKREQQTMTMTSRTVRVIIAKPAQSLSVAAAPDFGRKGW